MKLLLGIIILIMLIVSVRFRRFLGLLALMWIAGAFLFWQYQDYEENKSKNRIHPTEVILSNIIFKPINNNYEMTGRIRNNSEKYNLSGVQLSITAKDCTNKYDNNCIIISEKKEYIFISIPPKQARYFKKDIHLYSDQLIKDKVIWDYSVEYAESR